MSDLSVLGSLQNAHRKKRFLQASKMWYRRKLRTYLRKEINKEIKGTRVQEYIFPRASPIENIVKLVFCQFWQENLIEEFLEWSHLCSQEQIYLPLTHPLLNSVFITDLGEPLYLLGKATSTNLPASAKCNEDSAPSNRSFFYSFL